MSQQNIIITVLCPICDTISDKTGVVIDGYGVLSEIDVCGLAGDNEHCMCGYKYGKDDLRMESTEDPEQE